MTPKKSKKPDVFRRAHKSWDLCQVFQCRRKTASREKEKDLERRFCGHHMPANVVRFREVIEKGRLRHALCLLDVKILCRTRSGRKVDLLVSRVEAQGSRVLGLGSRCMDEVSVWDLTHTRTVLRWTGARCSQNRGGKKPKFVYGESPPEDVWEEGEKEGLVDVLEGLLDG